MKNLRYVVFLSFVLLFVLGSTVGASTSGVGTPTMYVSPTGSPNTVELRAQNITNGGTVGNGAVSWDVYFMTPNNVNLADITIGAGSAWLAQNCTFSTSKVSQAAVTAGKNAFLVSGFCNSAASGPAVTGADVAVASLTFSAAACSANPSGFIVDLHEGPSGDSTDFFDTANDLYIFKNASLTDGSVCSAPTAITIGEISANPIVPVSSGFIPVVAGAAVVLVAAAGVAFRGVWRQR